MIKLIKLTALMVLSLTSSGCQPSLDPENTGGVRINGTKAADCYGDAPLSVSPDGRWLLFARSQDMFMQAELGLIDLLLVKSHRPQPDAAASLRIADQHGPVIHASCWSADSNTVYISGKDIQGEVVPIIPSMEKREDSIAIQLSAKPSLHDKISNWFAIDIGQPALLYTVETPDCITNPPPAWRFGSNLDSTPASWFENNPDLQSMLDRVTRGLRLVQDSDQTISLQTEDGRMLAEHRTTSFWSTHISVTSYAWSDDGSRLAYVINEMAGSMTGPDNRAYVIDSAGSAEPEWIATDIEAIYWHGNDTLFACLNAGIDDEISIARWQF